MFKLKVTKTFQDKYTKKVYSPGDTLETEDLNRVNDLVKRNLCEITEVSSGESDKTDKVTFQDAEYDLSVVKEALVAMNLTTKNAGVKAVTKALESLNEEQAKALAETLKKEE